VGHLPYDNFGNRTNELESNSACPTTLTNGTSTHWWQYGNANNQVTGSDNPAGGLIYDSAGDVIQDANNRYAYDVEGRVCAVFGSGPTYTQYVYDAEGRRVAKGSIPSFPASGELCAAPTAANGFTLTNAYLRGSDGNQDTELTAAGLWHTNVFASGELLATYDYNPAVSSSPVLSYNFEDWLGTKRMQSTAAGAVAMHWSSDPFGDYLNATGSAGDATEQHFTGKERDAESGNDYFGARYYASNMGRFMSPDWSAKEEPVPYATMDDPQSLNLYSYVRNNPLSHADADGHCWPCIDAVVSSEQMNLYSGNVTTDELGQATVKLPDWFEVENGDFRYQLTTIGRDAHAWVAEEVANHQFKIATNATFVKVSWQITAVRQDAYAKAHPLVVEQEKSAEKRGYYLHPELYGQPMDKQERWVGHSRELAKRKAASQTAGQAAVQAGNPSH